MDIMNLIFSMQVIDSKSDVLIWNCLQILAQKSGVSAPISNIEILQACLTYLGFFQNVLWSFEAAFKYSRVFVAVYLKMEGVSPETLYDLFHMIEQREWTGKIQPNVFFFYTASRVHFIQPDALR
jgi:hypothetical protein